MDFVAYAIAGWVQLCAAKNHYRTSGEELHQGAFTGRHGSFQNKVGDHRLRREIFDCRLTRGNADIEFRRDE